MTVGSISFYRGYVSVNPALINATTFACPVGAVLTGDGSEF